MAQEAPGRIWLKRDDLVADSDKAPATSFTVTTVEIPDELEYLRADILDMFREEYLSISEERAEQIYAENKVKIKDISEALKVAHRADIQKLQAKNDALMAEIANLKA